MAFLDEPAAGVDVRGRQLIRSVVRDLAHDGACVLLTTHDLDEAERTADRVVIIDHGRLVATGTPQELMAGSGGIEIRFGAPPGIDTAALGRVVLAAVTEEAPGEYRVEAEASPATIAALTGWLAEQDLPLADLRAGRHRLEDVFLHLTSVTGEVPAVTATPTPEAGVGRGGRPGGAGRRRGPDRRRSR